MTHMCSGSCPCRTMGEDRHPKWQRVEPGTVIPAGQPYRIEYGEEPRWTAHEFSSLNDFPRPGLGNDAGEVFVDSSWRPPLELPTDPTWGVLVYVSSGIQLWISKFHKDGTLLRSRSGGYTVVSEIADFIPLTDEQVKRIEAAR